jgi:ribosomal protein L37E
MSTRVDFTISWPVEPEALNESRYPDLVIEVTGQRDGNGTPTVSVAGPLTSVALWVLIEYCGGEIAAANGIIHQIHSTDDRCQRCGNQEMTLTTITVCEDCGYQVTAVEATELLETRHQVVNQRRINI